MKITRSQTNDNINLPDSPPIHSDLIKETRKLIRGMTQPQRFAKAKKHLEDALAYKTPRPDAYSPSVSTVFSFVYTLQTSRIWQTFLFLLSFVFMYLIVLDQGEHSGIKNGLEITFLLVLWADVIFEIYHKTFEVLRISSKFQTRFYIRIILLTLLTMDQIIFLLADTSNPIRPFVVLRACLPICYDSVTRKAFFALFSSYKDIFVYVFFYFVVVLGFALVGSQIVIMPKEFDDLTQNYGNLQKMIFIMYVLSSYDGFPETQFPAIRESFGIYWFFILFIFLNNFLFLTIPTTILFNSFRETRSKIILIDEIKQQHSLILAFVSLGEENFNISQDKLIKFLLYVYKYKVRYVDYITEVCLKLDDNNNGEIRVNEFMQLCKILQSNSSMLPPTFEDWEKWMKFRNYVNNKFKLKAIINSTKFKVFIAIFVIITFINCLLALFTKIEAFKIVDDVLMGFFCLEIVLKIIGIGPENFFANKWNKLDFFLVLVGLCLEIIPDQYIPNNSDVLFKMTRIFRITTLIQHMKGQNEPSLHDSFYTKCKKLFSQTAIIIPIVIKFLPLTLITYYILGILGMEFFHQKSPIPPEDSPYSDYNQFSNFENFIASQLLFVQVETEAGWATIAYDHAYRYGYFFLVMFYFVFCHLVIVLLLSSLLKGLAWEVYYTVHEEFNEKILKREKEQIKENNLKKKKQELEEIKTRIDEKEILEPDNLISRELLEKKMDLIIFKKIKKLSQKNSQNMHQGSRKLVRSGIITGFIDSKNLSIDEISLGEELEKSQHHPVNKILEHKENFSDIQSIEEEDIEEEMEKVLSKIIASSKSYAFEAIAYPQVLTNFLRDKIVIPFPQFKEEEGFNIEKDLLSSGPAINFLTYELNVLMGIQKSEREQKTKIIENIVKEGILTEENAANLLTKKNQKLEGIDVNWIMRKMFLSDTNEWLIKKFQTEYFSSVYGRSFKEINKVTIQPLLQLQSRLTYCLKNALRYKEIEELSFFTILANIEDAISNKLLKKGSLFKFVYQLQLESDTWFSVEVSDSKELKIHFIKNGIWIYHKNMKQNQIHFGRDLFQWDFKERHDKFFCGKYLKMLYQSFETLAFCLVDEKRFFLANPTNYRYDLYSYHLNVENNPRFVHRKHSISKIMAVILSKEEEREVPLDYQISDLKPEQEKDLTFNFDESENETFKKLKKMELLDYEKIVETEGLPFAFVMNLMQEIKDIMSLYQQNFIHQIEKVLNTEFDQVE